MSGSVAEALLASGSKKLPLLPAPPKRKKEPKTFSFELQLTESTDQSYPEFSWTELVRNSKEKDLANRASSGNPVLDPFASDDEDDLKAMAAKFEAKYNSCPPKKKKRRVEDYIDRGAGYDESDPFIDNSDVYDEVVPPDLETVRGGFYINSGSLDFKEVELSEDEDDSMSPVKKKNQTQQPVKKAKVKITPTLQERSQLQKEKNPVGRPPGVKKQIGTDKDGLLKKRRMIVTPVGPGGKKPGAKLTRIKSNSNKDNRETSKLLGDKNSLIGKADLTKVKSSTERNSSSSGSGSSSSDESGSGSSSSDSESSSSEETEEKSKPKVRNVPPAALPMKTTPAPLEVTPMSKPKPVATLSRQLIDPSMPQLTKNIAQPQMSMQPKRVKTKNVPLNPKLHPNLSFTPHSTQPPSLSANTNPPPPPPLLQQPQKVLNKDLMKSNGTSNSLLMNLNARAQSQAQSSSSPSSSTNNSSPIPRAPTPKSLVSAASVSPSSSLTISAVTSNPQNSKISSNSTPLKTKAKAKQPPVTGISSNMPTFPTAEIINSITNYASLTNFSSLNFVPQIPSNSSLLKAGMNMLNPQKSMPNLKKIPQQGQPQGASADKLVQQKPKTPKVVKNKPNKSVGSMNVGMGNTSSSPSGLSSPFMSGGVTTTSSYLSSSTYKTPPPLGGPGVEISKVRSGNTSNISVNSTPKASPSPSSSSPLTLGNASSVYSSVSSVTSNAGLTSIFSSPNSLVNSVSSSLTVQRLPHSITITPSGHYSGGSATTTKASSSILDGARATKQYTSFDVQALLQGSSTNFLSSSQMSMNSSTGAKSSTGKPINSIVNNSRDLPRK